MAKRKYNPPSKSKGGYVEISDALAAKLRRAGLLRSSSSGRVLGSGKGKFLTGLGEYAQSGPRTSRAADTARKAKRPGWRISATGRPYFENRRNRSDRRGSRL